MSDDPLDESSRRAREATRRHLAMRRYEVTEVRCLEMALFARRAEELRQDERREREERPERVLH